MLIGKLYFWKFLGFIYVYICIIKNYIIVNELKGLCIIYNVFIF